MKTLAGVVCVLALALPGAAGAHASSSCEEAKRTNGWCEPANTGYMAGLEVRSRFLYEVLDAHGHDIVPGRSEEHTSELQSQSNLVCRLLLEKKKKNKIERFEISNSMR